MSDTKKKIGLFTCVATGIGAIIGSGIFERVRKSL